MPDKRYDQTTNASQVAAADNIPFITSGGITSYVTGDEFATSTPFSSRYVSKDDDSLGFGFPMTYGCLSGAPNNNSVLINNWGWLSRVIGSGTITKLGIHVAVSSGNISVAVFRPNAAGRPNPANMTRLATSGSVACPAAGFAEVSLGGSVAVKAGDYFALAADNTTATFRAVSGSGASGLFTGFNYVVTSGAMPWSSSFVVGQGVGDNQFAIIGVA